MKNILAIVIMLFAFMGRSQNISTYNQTWLSGAIQKNFDVKNKGNALNIRVDGSYRSIDWFKYNRQFLIRGITTWNFNDTWRLGAGPCWSWQYPYYDVKPVLEFRPTAQIIFTKMFSQKSKFEKNHFDYSLRFRWELRYFKINEEWSDVFHRFRVALRYNIPVKENISFTPQIESMWQKNPDNTFEFSVLRIFPSLNFKYKGINYQIGYMFQFIERGSVDEIDNNYTLGFTN